MYFVMYVNGKQVDRVQISVGKINISQLMQELRNKHRGLLKSAETEPVFALEHVPSSINTFQPLKAG
jgi:hypothetical protein